jgi:hypothetical protein
LIESRIRKFQVGKHYLNVTKKKYETVLNWLYIQYNGKEEFWSELEKDACQSKLRIYKYRLCQIVRGNGKRNLISLMMNDLIDRNSKKKNRKI